MIEMMVVVALIGALVAIAVPRFDQFFANQRAKSAARSLADAFRIAQADAIRTGDPHIVYLSASAAGNPPATDPGGTQLLSPSGVVLPAVILDDRTPALSNCVIDGGETQTVIQPQIGVAWGVSRPGSPLAPDDNSGLNPNAGSTFRSPGGVAVTWVMFRPDGLPVSFDAACNQGTVGTGGGAAYITNGSRDYAVVVTPLGGVRVHGWNAEANAWTN